MASSAKQDHDRERKLWEVADRLETKLRALNSEDDFAHGLNPLCDYPSFESRDLSQLEMDLRDWGFTYGLAFGLAMADNPDLSHEEAAKLAFKPALREYLRWSGEIADPVLRRENAIRNLVRAFDEAEEDRWQSGSVGQPRVMPDKLASALGELAESARA